MTRRAHAAAAVALLGACSQPAPPPAPVRPPAPTTPTTVAATTTTAPPAAVAPTTAATAPAGPSRVPAPVASAGTTAGAGGAADVGDDFYRRLADCECASGHCGGPHVGWFQFSADTARKVGIDGSESYEEQRAAAQEWARRIHPREATSAGWPHCWRVAAA